MWQWGEGGLEEGLTKVGTCFKKHGWEGERGCTLCHGAMGKA